MPDSWTFIVPGRPVGNQSKQSATVMKNGRPITIHYTPNKTRNFHALVTMCALAAQLPKLDYAIVDIAICIPCRVKRYKTRADEWLEPKVRPDRDNVAKIVGDALQGIAYLNDKNIQDGRTYYKYLPPDQQPYTEITIRETDWHHYIHNSEELPS